MSVLLNHECTRENISINHSPWRCWTVYWSFNENLVENGCFKRLPILSKVLHRPAVLFPAQSTAAERSDSLSFFLVGWTHVRDCDVAIQQALFCITGSCSPCFLHDPTSHPQRCMDTVLTFNPSVASLWVSGGEVRGYFYSWIVVSW